MQGVAVRSLGQSWIALPRSQVEVIVRIGGLNVILFDPLCLLKTLGSHSICLSVMLAGWPSAFSCLVATVVYAHRHRKGPSFPRAIESLR